MYVDDSVIVSLLQETNMDMALSLTTCGVVESTIIKGQTVEQSCKYLRTIIDSRPEQ